MDIYKFENESDTVYNYRLSFITKNSSSDKFDKNTLIKYSKILANIKFKHCKYDSKIYNMLKEYI